MATRMSAWGEGLRRSTSTGSKTDGSPSGRLGSRALARVGAVAPAVSALQPRLGRPGVNRVLSRNYGAEVERGRPGKGYILVLTANWHYIYCQLAEELSNKMSDTGSPRPVLDVGAPPPPANLADPPTRERLTPAAVEGLVRLAEIWRLTSTEVCSLLGDTSERTWFRMKKREWSGTLSQDSLTRVSVIIGIFKGLRLLFSEPLSDEWVRLPNKGSLYGGRRPLDVMIEGGIPKMLEVRRHIDASRGGL